jgi:2-polyprenyl-3-methyl-5-hydroxy-6-metoxy-1,4-benzoquinol methylase
VSRSAGMVYRPLADCWQIAADTDVNYLMTAEKTA